jgi:CrcB protein
MTATLSNFLLVFLGGGLGSICRYALSLALAPWQPRFPWATLLANGLACLALGYLIGLQAETGTQGLSTAKRLLLATGFCGGFSTFSTFTAENWQLWHSGQALAALLNLLANLALCLLCLWWGLRWALGGNG